MKDSLEETLESNDDYGRLLAALSPDERLRILGRDFGLQKQLLKKKQYRRALAHLSLTEKMKLLEELRERAEIQRGKRRSPELEQKHALTEKPKKGKRPGTAAREANAQRRFGGRATATGVRYETQVAAALGVKMLAGAHAAVWEGLAGDKLGSITMQAPEPVDDIVLTLNQSNAKVFISAKARNQSIPLTPNGAFDETMACFVAQFLKDRAAITPRGRLVWAVTTGAGRQVVDDLAAVLGEYRNSNTLSQAEFLQSRQNRKARAFEALTEITRKEWKKNAGSDPSESELREFYSSIYVEVYDFGTGQPLINHLETEIRSLIVSDPTQASYCWEKLQGIFLKLNCTGGSIDGTLLREKLLAEGIQLNLPPDFSQDINKLQSLTVENTRRLKAHCELDFGDGPNDRLHIDRNPEVTALFGACKQGHLLITGEPGSGKSGLIHDLCLRITAEKERYVLLLAEQALPVLSHSIDEVLSNWVDGKKFYFITDALDAIRDPDKQRELRELIEKVKARTSECSVIASVREFDLKHSVELRRLFPGAGVSQYSCSDFAGVAHFHVPKLTDGQLDSLASSRPEIRDFIQAAQAHPKSGGLHKSPFYLRIAADLLRSGVAPARLADWHSPALLLRKFWDVRVRQGTAAGERESTLRKICKQMTVKRRMGISSRQLDMPGSEIEQIDELRRRGILQTPALLKGSTVGGDEIRFSHHLLHDYAIARALMPEMAEPFCEFTEQHEMLPIFYRQSYVFALEEIWDSSEKEQFWRLTFRLEGSSHLHGIVRILPSMLAARRIEEYTEIEPLVTALREAPDADSSAIKALIHVANGLREADEAVISTAASAWSQFVMAISGFLVEKPWIEGPLVHILARINRLQQISSGPHAQALNAAARALLEFHFAKPAGKGWSYASAVSIEAIAHTFHAAPSESEFALLTLFDPNRLSHFPHNELFDVAQHVKNLVTQSSLIVTKAFEAAFGSEPKPDVWEDVGTRILGMRIQTRDEWHTIRHVLAEWYAAWPGEDAGLATELVCIAWNAVAFNRQVRRDRETTCLARISFMGHDCELPEDYGHIWGREFEHEENRMLCHFEELLSDWAAANDDGKVNAALDAFARRCKTSLMWSVLLEIGAKYPATLGIRLAEVLNEPVFLTHPDYIYGAVKLFGALHRNGDRTMRETLERLILDLPQKVHPRNEAESEHVTARAEHGQNYLLASINEQEIALESLRNLWKERKDLDLLEAVHKRGRTEARWVSQSDEELMLEAGIDPSNPENQELLALRKELETLVGKNEKQPTPEQIDSHWPLIEKCECAVAGSRESQPKMAAELWGHLVGACETITRRASWPSSDPRWLIIRRILLAGSHDPVPRPKDENDEKDEWPSWRWPAPRLDAARGLCVLAYRVGGIDPDSNNALRRLAQDESHAVRFNLAREIGILRKPASNLMFELIDFLIENELKFSVLDGLLHSHSWLKASDKQVMPRLKLIADRASKSAPVSSGIHKTLAQTYLFRYLRSGNRECRAYIEQLIAHCDTKPATDALLPQLHACRSGGWMTAGDAVQTKPTEDEIRTRTWWFFSELLRVAQQKLGVYREERMKVVEARREDAGEPREELKNANRLVDAVAMQLYFGSGAFAKRGNKEDKPLTQPQLRRFWNEARPILTALADEIHPHTAHHVVQTLHHLIGCAPREVFLIAMRTIKNSSKAGFQYESLAVADVVKLIQQALADHRDLFQDNSDCLRELLSVLDLFVEAGWAEARQLTHRLEEIYR